MLQSESCSIWLDLKVMRVICEAGGFCEKTVLAPVVLEAVLVETKQHPKYRGPWGYSESMRTALTCCFLVIRVGAAPQTVQQFVSEGIQLARHDRLDEAAQRFRQAIEADPANADARNDLGVILRREKKFNEALAAFEGASRLRPGEARIHSDVALTLADLGRLPDALTAMQRARELEPRDAAIQRNFGGLYWLAGEEL